jgi:hypothetical protein
MVTAGLTIPQHGEAAELGYFLRTVAFLHIRHEPL